MTRQTSPRSTAPSAKLDVRTSAIHGRGVFAARALRANEIVGTYAGRRYRAEDVHAKDWDPMLTYVFGLSDGSFIDASEGGNATRFINHSCEPNCVAFEVERTDASVEIRAARAIRKGEELLLDYGLDIADNDPSLYACRCATANCRGTMIAAAAANTG